MWSLGMQMAEQNNCNLKKMYLLTYKSNEDSNQPEYLCSLVSLHCPPWKNWFNAYQKMHLVKLLIRLHKCADWSESLLGAYALSYISFPCISNVVYTSILSSRDLQLNLDDWSSPNNSHYPITVNFQISPNASYTTTSL